MIVIILIKIKLILSKSWTPAIDDVAIAADKLIPIKFTIQNHITSSHFSSWKTNIHNAVKWERQRERSRQLLQFYEVMNDFIPSEIPPYLEFSPHTLPITPYHHHTPSLFFNLSEKLRVISLCLAKAKIMSKCKGSHHLRKGYFLLFCIKYFNFNVIRMIAACNQEIMHAIHVMPWHATATVKDQKFTQEYKTLKLTKTKQKNEKEVM